MNEGRGRERHRNPDPPSRKASRISSTSPSVKSEFPEPQEVVCWLSCMHHMRLSLRQLWALGGTGPGLPSLVQPHPPPLASTAAASSAECAASRQCLRVGAHPSSAFARRGRRGR